MEKDMIRELYDRYYGEAILYATAICQNADLAGDLVADAFVKACIALPKDVSSFRFWLFRVCKNLLRRFPAQTAAAAFGNRASAGSRPSNPGDPVFGKRALSLSVAGDLLARAGRPGDRHAALFFRASAAGSRAARRPDVSGGAPALGKAAEGFEATNGGTGL